MPCYHLHRPLHLSAFITSNPAVLRNPPRLSRVRADSGENIGEPEQPLSAAQQAVQERIRRAKEYKSTSSAASEPAQAAQNPSSAESSAERQVSEEDGFNARLAEYGAEAAGKQREAFQAAMDSLDTENGGSAPQLEGDSQSFLKQQRVVKMGASGSNRISPTLHAKLKTFVETARPDTFASDSFSSAREEQDGGSAGPLSGPTSEDVERQQSAMSGSDSKAATYLDQVSQTEISEAAALRPEMFTAYKEEQEKARGVEFITKDKDYNPLEAQSDPTYKPKVATWGMFPRPPDISKTYGGGRTYRPGEALESTEQAQQRKDRVSAAILDYRRKQGLFVDPEEEQKWNSVFSLGMQMLEIGNLTDAIGQFEDVMKAVPPRTKLGGEAQLQRAICLDSAGRNDEAYKIYMVLERHPNAIVQKQAKRMLFGFRAADNLKASTMSYAIGAKGNKDWDKYFTKLGGEWNSGYIGPEEDQTSSNVLAAAVVLLPLLLISLFIVSKL